MYINVLVVSKTSMQAEAQLYPLLMISSLGTLWSLGCSHKVRIPQKFLCPLRSYNWSWHAKREHRSKFLGYSYIYKLIISEYVQKICDKLVYTQPAILGPADRAYTKSRAYTKPHTYYLGLE